MNKKPDNIKNKSWLLLLSPILYFVDIRSLSYSLMFIIYYIVYFAFLPFLLTFCSRTINRYWLEKNNNSNTVWIFQFESELIKNYTNFNLMLLAPILEERLKSIFQVNSIKYFNTMSTVREFKKRRNGSLFLS